MQNLIHKLNDTITLDSKDRESYSVSGSDFEIKLPFSSRDTDFIHIREIQFPNVIDNVVSSNNGFEIDDVAGTIHVGQYTIGALMDELTATIAGYTFTLEHYSRVTITSDAPAIFKWEPLQTADLFGFTAAVYNGATSYTAEYYPNLLPTNYFTLHSSFIASRQDHAHYHTDQRSDMIAKMHMQDLGELLVWEPEEPLFKRMFATNLSIIDFQVRDVNNTVIDIQNKTVVIDMDRVSASNIL